MTAFNTIQKTFTECVIATIVLTLLGVIGVKKTEQTPVTVNLIGAGPVSVQARIYSADYCVPCKTYIKAIKADMPADGWVIKDATDKDTAAAHIVIDKRAAELERLGIDRIPCTVFFKDDKEVRRVYGALSPADLAKQYNEVGMK